MAMFIDVVFDGPPGPTAGRFVEVEDSEGRSISIGEWIEEFGHPHLWRLRLPDPRLVDYYNGLLNASLLTLMVARGQLRRGETVRAGATLEELDYLLSTAKQVTRG